MSHEGVGKTAVDECTRGMERLFGPDIFQSDSDYSIILKIDNNLPKESYRLTSEEKEFYIEGGDQSGVLYGVFATMLRLGSGEVFENINENSAPAVPLRLLNHWDNLDGSVERGYAGKSIFFKDGDFCYEPERIRDYARLLASVGINGLAINNVNVTSQSARLITAEMLPKVAALADLFRPYGIRDKILVYLLLEPELVHKMMKKLGEFNLNAAESLLKCGVDSITFCDDMGSGNNLLFSPTLYEEFFFPWHKELADLCHSYRAYAHMHSHGNINKIMGKIVDAGIDMLNPCDPYENMD